MRPVLCIQWNYFSLQGAELPHSAHAWVLMDLTSVSGALQGPGDGPTCAHCLPSHREGGPCLYNIHCNRAVVVCSWPPGQLSSGVGDFIYCHSFWWTWGTCWKSYRRGMLEASQWLKEGALWSSSLTQDRGNQIPAEDLTATPAVV